jgi:hypothetical protein
MPTYNHLAALTPHWYYFFNFPTRLSFHDFTTTTTTTTIKPHYNLRLRRLLGTRTQIHSQTAKKAQARERPTIDQIRQEDSHFRRWEIERRML